MNLMKSAQWTLCHKTTNNQEQNQQRLPPTTLLRNMGSAQSTQTVNLDNKNFSKKEESNDNLSGPNFSENLYVRTEDCPIVSDDDDDEEEDLHERLVILSDARKLKNLAEFFLKPELPVAVDATATARCYFDRPSAPIGTDEEERELIMADLNQLRKLATDYLCPELPVTTSDPFACGRNYYRRFSAVPTTKEDCIYDDCEKEKKRPRTPPKYVSWAPTTDEECIWDDQDEDDHQRILRDSEKLKVLALDYLHPELPVIVTDPYACGRNYFVRNSSPVQEDPEEEEELKRILKESQQLKKLAIDYLHPELPVETSDPFACARNYYTRPSAQTHDDIEDKEDQKERLRIIEESKRLKSLAVDYLHPERPVRNDFTSPPVRQLPDDEVENLEGNDEDCNDEECARIFEEIQQMKKLAVDYLHPELPVLLTDPFACARNYFNRPSALTHESFEEEEERIHILHDAEQLKHLAVDYLCPEQPVKAKDPYLCGRNYFMRPSAPTQQFLDELEESARILEELEKMGSLATDYFRPERPVETTDPCAFGRNYYSRPSASMVEDDIYRASVLKDTKMLKLLTLDYYCPEIPVVTTDPHACGRNFFTRPSAAIVEDESYRSGVLDDIKKLGKLAMDYQHPEKSVKATDPLACARNFFTRPSAPGPAKGETHTYCEYVDHGYHHVIDHDHHYYWYNNAERKAKAVETVYEFKETTLEVEPFKSKHGMDMKSKDEIALSRSPQCVLMLTWPGMASE